MRDSRVKHSRTTRESRITRSHFAVVYCSCALSYQGTVILYTHTRIKSKLIAGFVFGKTIWNNQFASDAMIAMCLLENLIEYDKSFHSGFE